jgi:protein TonB
MHYIGQALPDQRLKRALLVALLLHVALLVGVSFNLDSEEHYRSQIDVTLARQPTSEAPERATHLAQANQLGSGEPAPAIDAGGSAAAAGAQPVMPPPAPRQQGSRQRRDDLLTTSAASAHKLAREQADSTDSGAEIDSPEADSDPLSQELAQLEAALEQQSRAYADLPRVRRLTSRATRESADAAYLHQWRQRVEAVGNRYYPRASVRYGIYGSLRLLVVIDYRGRLEDMRVLSSSGYALLDEAAMKIVRMAAPYPPFPPELRATADKVEIVRTWQFEENGLSSG